MFKMVYICTTAIKVDATMSAPPWPFSSKWPRWGSCPTWLQRGRCWSNIFRLLYHSTMLLSSSLSIFSLYKYRGMQKSFLLPANTIALHGVTMLALHLNTLGGDTQQGRFNGLEWTPKIFTYIYLFSKKKKEISSVFTYKKINYLIYLFQSKKKKRHILYTLWDRILGIV